MPIQNWAALFLSEQSSKRKVKFEKKSKFYLIFHYPNDKDIPVYYNLAFTIQNLLSIQCKLQNVVFLNEIISFQYLIKINTHMKIKIHYTHAGAKATLHSVNLSL